MTGELELVVEIINPATGCVSATPGFSSDLASVEAAMGCELPALSEGAAYELERAEIAALAQAFNLPALSGGKMANLRMRSGMDDWPYACHTMRELDMMLAGTKPLAAFYGDMDWLKTTRAYFTPHVAAGTIVEHAFEEVVAGRSRAILRLLYTLPGEEWRAQAYLDLWHSAAEGGWSDAHERREGELLGYENWQNDWFMARRRALTAETEV